MIVRLIEARRNEIRSQPRLFEARSSGRPPRSAGTRCLAFIKAHLCRCRLPHLLIAGRVLDARIPLPFFIASLDEIESAPETGSERTPRCRSGDPFIAIMSSAWIAAVAGRCFAAISRPVTACLSTPIVLTGTCRVSIQ